jgi:polygalacturonase
MKNRREFLQKSLLAGGALLAGSVFGQGTQKTHSYEGSAEEEPWNELPALLARIKAPVFPPKEFVVTKFGAVGNGKTDCTQAFRHAIASCVDAGGGEVVVPAGEFLTGAIELKSNVNLHVRKGAVLRFTRDLRKYPLVLTRFEGVELMNYSPFIYACRQENIAVTGEGTIDGGSDSGHWWPWKGETEFGWKKGDPTQESDRSRLFAMAERGVPVPKRVFGPGHYLRPQFIEPYACNNVLIEGVSLRGSPMWQVHPVLCTNVTVRGLNVDAPGPNTDGCDPESCTDVLIENCYFNTGDDCIALKAGRNADGRRLHAPTRNVVIRGCRMKNGHGGVSVGSEATGGASNVFVEDCHMDSPGLRYVIHIKSNTMRGGLVENIYVRNVDVGQISRAALAIDFSYEEGGRGSFTPIVREVELRNVTVKKAGYALVLRGYESAPIGRIRLMNCDFEAVAKPNIVQNAKEISARNVQLNGKPLNL